MFKTLKIAILALMLSALFATASLAFAQDATQEATTEAVVEGESAAIASESEISDTSGNPTGLSAAMLFLGAGAIIFVGALMIARDSFRSEPE